MEETELSMEEVQTLISASYTQGSVDVCDTLVQTWESVIEDNGGENGLLDVEGLVTAITTLREYIIATMKAENEQRDPEHAKH